MKKLFIIALFLLFTGCNPTPVVDPIEHGKAMFSEGFEVGVNCMLIAATKKSGASHDELRQEARRIYNHVHYTKDIKSLPRM